MIQIKKMLGKPNYDYDSIKINNNHYETFKTNCCVHIIRYKPIKINAIPNSCFLLHPYLFNIISVIKVTTTVREFAAMHENCSG